MVDTSPDTEKIEIFISYSHRDDSFRRQLKTHLSLLEVEYGVRVWSDRDIPAGGEWESTIVSRLGSAQIVLLLISSDYLDSSACRQEMETSLSRQNDGEATVIPIIIRPCDWVGFTSFSRLQALPQDGKPVSQWENEDEAFKLIAAGIREAVGNLRGHPRRATAGTLDNDRPNSAPCFTGREELLKSVRTLLATSRPVLLHGMGGAGKTQVAATFAYRFRGDYRTIWWFPCAMQESIDQALRDLVRNVGSRSGNSHRETMRHLCDQLDQRGPWLLIFDDAASLAELPDHLWNLPIGDKGHLLITSRAPYTGGLAEGVKVSVWSRAESLTFFERRLRRSDESADSLAARLGDLPLALAQAASYIEREAIATDDYLAALDQELEGILSERDPLMEYPESVAGTWKLSCEAAEAKSPLSIDLLRISAFLQGVRITRSFLRGCVEGQTERAYQQALGTLHAYSLIELGPDSFTLHPLVALITRARLTPVERWKYANRARQRAAELRKGQQAEIAERTETYMCLCLASLYAIQDMEPTLMESLDRLNTWENRGLPADVTEKLIHSAEALQATSEEVAECFKGASLAFIAFYDALEAYDRQKAPVSFLHKSHALLWMSVMFWERLCGEKRAEFAESLRLVGYVSRGLNDWSATAEHYSRARTILLDSSVGDYPGLALASIGLCEALRKLGKRTEALEALQTALPVDDVNYPLHRRDLCDDLRILGECLDDLTPGDPDGFLCSAGRPAYEREFFLRNRDESDLGWPWELKRDECELRIGMSYIMSDAQLAREHLEELNKRLETDRHGGAPLLLAFSLGLLGLALHRLEEREKATACLRRRYDLLTSTGTDESTWLDALLRKLTGQLLQEAGEFEEAGKHFAAEFALNCREYGTESVESAEAGARLGSNLYKLGDFTGARAALTGAVAVLERNPDSREGLGYAHALFSLGSVHGELEEFEEACVVLARAQPIFSAQLGADDEYVIAIETFLTNYRGSFGLAGDGDEVESTDETIVSPEVAPQ